MKKEKKGKWKEEMGKRVRKKEDKKKREREIVGR
jgi:hypothetical protein